MTGISHIVYDPPVSSLPYLVVMFLPDGMVDVESFKDGRDAHAFAIRMARAARQRSGEKEFEEPD
jgi:hypothetical protein